MAFAVRSLCCQVQVTVADITATDFGFQFIYLCASLLSLQKTRSEASEGEFQAEAELALYSDGLRGLCLPWAPLFPCPWQPESKMRE